MDADERSLERTQRWMQAVIMHPGEVAEGIAEPAAQEQIPLDPARLDEVILPSQRLTSAERLSIYASAYYARLIECFREEYPALRHTLGDETFDAFVVGYLQRYPSASYTLANLGARFPQFIAETRPPREQLDVPDWADFMIDLVTLERTYSEVFDGPGIENLPPLAPVTLSEISPAAWPNARLTVAPCVRLTPLKFPAHEYITAVRRGESPGIPASASMWLVVSRANYIVRRRAVTREEFVLLGELASGRAVGEAIERAAADSTLTVDKWASQLRQWFHAWTSAGFFTRVEC